MCLGGLLVGRRRSDADGRGDDGDGEHDDCHHDDARGDVQHASSVHRQLLIGIAAGKAMRRRISSRLVMI